VFDHIPSAIAFQILGFLKVLSVRANGSPPYRPGLATQLRGEMARLVSNVDLLIVTDRDIANIVRMNVRELSRTPPADFLKLARPTAF
jgi:hypothetical protein